MYHPEYVCDGGLVDPIRRSPFPTLLIKHCGLKDELFKPSGMYRFGTFGGRNQESGNIMDAAPLEEDEVEGGGTLSFLSLARSLARSGCTAHALKHGCLSRG